MSQVDFYYDYVSPYSYLAYSQLNVMKDAGAEINHCPIFLGALFTALGATAPLQRPGAKRPQYLFADMARWCRYYGIPMQMNPAFPMSTLHLLRGSGLAKEKGVIEEYSRLAFQAVWVESRDVSDKNIARSIAESAGLNVDEFDRFIGDGVVKTCLKDDTKEALERGVFGVPTLFIGDSQYFGNDRLHFVLNKLKRLGE